MESGELAEGERLAPVLQLGQLMSNDMPIVYKDVAYGMRAPVKAVGVDIAY